MPNISKYKAEFAQQAFIACSEMGAVDHQLCKLFGVRTRRTLDEWKRKHPEFKEAVTNGKDIFNNGKAEDALMKRILGFSYWEETQELRKVFENVVIDGKKYKLLKDQQLVTVKRVKKYIPPDTGAIAFYLKCRDKDRWKDKGGFSDQDGLTIIVKHEKA